MNKLFAIGFLCISSLINAQPSLLVDKIVGIIDDKIVLLSDVEAQYIQMASGTTQKIPEDYKCSILDGMLVQKLLVTQAALDSVFVTDEEVEDQLDARIRYYAQLIGGTDELEKYYGKSIIEMKEEFRSNIREQAVAEKERGNIISGITVTPSEIASYFNKIPKDSLPYYNSEMEIGQVVIYPKVSDDVKAYAKQKITDLLNRVKGGEDFASLARTYSEDPGSADDGGDLGFKNRDELDPAFASAAFKLKTPNEVSDVVESKFGYHIIQLIERRGDRIHVRHILIEPKVTSFDLNAAKHQADSIYYLIQSGKYNFSQAAFKFSEDETSKNNGGLLVNPVTNNNEFEVNDLGSYDASLVKITDTLQVGSVSAPILFKDSKGKNAYRIIYLKSKTRPHQANLKDDYDKIQSLALSDKQFKIITDWIDERIAKSYVYIAPDFENCNEMQKWIKKEQ